MLSIPTPDSRQPQGRQYRGRQYRDRRPDPSRLSLGRWLFGLVSVSSLLLCPASVAQEPGQQPTESTLSAERAVEVEVEVEVEVADPPAACDSKVVPQRGLRQARLRLPTESTGRRTIRVELAETPEQRRLGMMCRTRMPEDTGMLFVYTNERPRRFWMKNTLLPLDMLFLDASWTVVGIVANAMPLDTTSRGVDSPSRYVLELRGGEAGRRSLGVGMRLELLP